MVPLGCLLLLAAPPGDPVLTAAATDRDPLEGAIALIVEGVHSPSGEKNGAKVRSPSPGSGVGSS